MERKAEIVIRNINLVKNKYRNELSFEANFTPFERNKFRRILMCELSTIAVDKVLIISNGTILTNEQIFQRIELLPVMPSIRKNFLEKDKCDCEKSCEKCSLYYKFDLSYQIINRNVVYTQDIFPLFYPNIHVVSLLENKGSLTGIIKLTRKNPLLHCKWSLPIRLEFKDNLYTLSTDFDYDLLDVLNETITHL